MVSALISTQRQIALSDRKGRRERNDPRMRQDDSWDSLPDEIKSLVLAKLDEDDLLNYASTSSTSFIDVFLSSSRFVVRVEDTPIIAILARIFLSPGAERLVMSSAHVIFEGDDRCCDASACPVELTLPVRMVPACAAFSCAILAAERRLLSSIEGILSIASDSGVLGAIERIDTSYSSLSALPEGMTSLRQINVEGCCELEPYHNGGENSDDDADEKQTRCWLPKTSATNLDILCAADSSIDMIPPYLSELRVLDINDCEVLRDGDKWLPSSAAHKIEELRAARIDKLVLPAGLSALRRLDVTASNPQSDWLPVDARKNLAVIDASYSSLTHLPSGLRALERLNIASVAGTEDDGDGGGPSPRRLRLQAFLAPDSRFHLEFLNISGTCAHRLPTGLCGLRHLVAIGCTCLHPTSWISMDSRRRLEVLEAPSSGIRRLPAGLTALKELDLRRCKLSNDPNFWLPPDGRERLLYMRISACGGMRLSMDALALYLESAVSLAEGHRVPLQGWQPTPPGVSRLTPLTDIKEDSKSSRWNTRRGALLVASDLQKLTSVLPHGLVHLTRLYVEASKDTGAGDWREEGSRAFLSRGAALAARQVSGVDASQYNVFNVDDDDEEEDDDYCDEDGDYCDSDMSDVDDVSPDVEPSFTRTG